MAELRYGYTLRDLHQITAAAWSFDARRKPPLPGCLGHKNCANCPAYALRWRGEVLAAMRRPAQPTLFAGVA